MASDKTNVMRVLEQHKIAYKPHEYPHGKDAVFDESVNNVPTVMVSAGKIGFQIECAPADLIKLTRAATAHITTD